MSNTAQTKLNRLSLRLADLLNEDDHHGFAEVSEEIIREFGPTRFNQINDELWDNKLNSILYGSGNN